MKKIFLVGLVFDNNFGDAVVYDNCKYLCTKINSNIEYEPFDLYGRNQIDINQYNINLIQNQSLIKRLFNKICVTKNHFLYNFYTYISYNRFKKRNKTYFEKIKTAYKVIFCGGALINKHLINPINYVLDICKKNNIPVMFNSIGIEINRLDYCFSRYKRLLSYKCIKLFTYRDNFDFISLINTLDLKKQLVGDIALFSSETYGIIKKESNIIGINVIRPCIFSQYGKNISAEQYISFIIAAINYYKNNGNNVIIYTNGDYQDNIAAEQIANSTNTKIIIPTNPLELINIISMFKAIVASRLHSSIIAYS